MAGNAGILSQNITINLRNISRVVSASFIIHATMDPALARVLQDHRDIVRDQQQFLQEKFRRYRRGDFTYLKKRSQIQDEFEAGDQAHELAIQARQVPRPGSQWPSRLARRRGRLRALGHRVPYTPPEGNPPASNLDLVRRDIAREEVNRITRMITATRNFTFVKVLGAGGNGIVALWRWTPGSNAAQAVGYDVAMKLSLLMDGNGDVVSNGVDIEKATMQVRGGTPNPMFFCTEQFTIEPCSGAAHNTTLFLP